MRNLKWKIAAMASVTALAIGGVAGFAGIAGAEPGTRTSTSVVDGLGAVGDDFNDHAKELGAPLRDHGKNSWGTDTVIMWQAILTADGYLGLSDVDGYFGKDTAQATAKWQADRGIDADKPGTVGHTTWAYADNSLVPVDATRLVYQASDDDESIITFTRRAAPDGRYRLATVGEDEDFGGETFNNAGGSTIKHFGLTIDLTDE